MTCGFTDDFANFIKNNGKDSPIKAIQPGTLTELISSAVLLEERLMLRRKSLRPPLSSSTETVISGSEEVALMDTFPGRPVSESLPPIWEHRDIPRQSFTQPLGAQPILTSPTRTTMLRSMSCKWEPSSRLCLNTLELLRSMWLATPWVSPLEGKSSREDQPLTKRRAPMMSELPFQAKSRLSLVLPELILAWLLAGTWELSPHAATSTVLTLEPWPLPVLPSSCLSWTATLPRREPIFTPFGPRMMTSSKRSVLSGAKWPAELIANRERWSNQGLNGLTLQSEIRLVLILSIGCDLYP